jgi:hypothetical protein
MNHTRIMATDEAVSYLIAPAVGGVFGGLMGYFIADEICKLVCGSTEVAGKSGEMGSMFSMNHMNLGKSLDATPGACSPAGWGYWIFGGAGAAGGVVLGFLVNSEIGL